MLQKKRKFDTTAFLFIAPAFILFTVFLIVPTVSSFYYSFTSWDGINPNIKFIGFDNYKEIFTSARFGNALKNTALLTVVISICENALALGLALLVDNVIKGKNLFRAIFYLPVILSGIVSGFIWKIMYSYNFGPVNKVLDMIGLGTLKQDWLGNADIAIWAVALVMIWKGAGYLHDHLSGSPAGRAAGCAGGRHHRRCICFAAVPLHHAAADLRLLHHLLYAVADQRSEGL